MTDETSRRRPRFSLLSMLLAQLILGLAITTYVLYREVGPLRADNKRLNEERGTLVIDDPTRLCSIKIPRRFAGADQVAFRIYVPPKQTYLAFVQINDIPKDGYHNIDELPSHAGILGLYKKTLFARLEPGESTLVLRTARRGSRGADIVLLKGGRDLDSLLDVSANTPEDQWPSVTPETYSVYGSGVGKNTTYVDGSGRLVLLRRRIQGVSTESLNVSYSIPEPDCPLDGVMLWLERQQ